MSRIVLASRSATRIALLKAAGIAFDATPSNVDERATESSMAAGRLPPIAVAQALAEAKALALGDLGDACVIGSDQVLEAEGERWSKPPSLDAARRQLATLAGRTHRLHTGVAGVRDGKVRWRHLDTARLTMRPLTTREIDAYLDDIGEAALTSVGAYQIEGPGIRLFERIEGDYFTILGLPVLPVLGWLRSEGALE